MATPSLTPRQESTWLKWRQGTGIKMPEHLKVKSWWLVICPVALNGAECWPTTSGPTLLRCKMCWWTLSLTCFDHTMTEDMTKPGVASIKKKENDGSPSTVRKYMWAMWPDPDESWPHGYTSHLASGPRTCRHPGPGHMGMINYGTMLGKS